MAETAYNEEQFYPAHGTHGTVGVTSRVMKYALRALNRPREPTTVAQAFEVCVPPAASSYFCNMNSKTFFRFVREDTELLTGYRPVSMHVNYHPEKPQRMVDLHAYYYKGDTKGIWKWNGGEGSRLESSCKRAIKHGRPDASAAAILKTILAAGGKAEWGGIKYVEFHADGKFRTPWGDGKWGDATSTSAPRTVWAEFIGQTHLLAFSGLEPDATYESTRCSDGEKVSGKLVQGA